MAASRLVAAQQAAADAGAKVAELEAEAAKVKVAHQGAIAGERVGEHQGGEKGCGAQQHMYTG